MLDSPRFGSIKDLVDRLNVGTALSSPYEGPLAGKDKFDSMNFKLVFVES